MTGDPASGLNLVSARHYAVVAALSVRNPDDELVTRLRVRAAESARSVEAEHCEILRVNLAGGTSQATREQAIKRLAEFRHRTGARGSPPFADPLDESRSGRLEDLAGTWLYAGVSR